MSFISKLKTYISELDKFVDKLMTRLFLAVAIYGIGVIIILVLGSLGFFNK